MDFIEMKKEFRSGLVNPISLCVRGPTQLQIQRWEYDGGHYLEAENVVLIDGELCLNFIDKLKARVRSVQSDLKQGVHYEKWS